MSWSYTAAGIKSELKQKLEQDSTSHYSPECRALLTSIPSLLTELSEDKIITLSTNGHLDKNGGYATLELKTWEKA